MGNEKVDQQFKRLMKELGDAINESLSDSEQIAHVVARIKSEGYDVFLVLEATVGFNKQRDDEDDQHDRQGNLIEMPTREPEFSINAQDLRFLKSLRIAVNDSDSSSDSGRAA